MIFGASDGASKFYNDMWAMNLQNNTWQNVKLDGAIPEARYTVIRSFQRFAKQDDSIRSALISNHGYGKNGPLSDTYKCTFSETGPYRAT